MKHISYIIIGSLMALLFVQSTQAGDKKIGIIVFNGVLTSDITAPLEVFGIASKQSWFTDYNVVTINVSDTKSITTEEGLKLQTDYHLKEAPVVDVLVVPSSYNMSPLINNKTLINYIQDTAKTAQWLASNCSGAFILAEAGLLNGRKATTWYGGEQSLEKEYPEVDVQFNQNVVIDDNIITSNGSLVSYQAALILLAKMSSQNKAKDVADTLQYSRFSSQPYLSNNDQ